MRTHLVADEEWVERFKREACALSQLRNDHIVNMYFMGIFHHTYPYIVMELLTGRSLRGLLTNEHLDWRRACAIMIQVCDALTQVHCAGFVHRDLKPDNIFITSQDGGDFVRILDFGLCTHDQFHTLTHADDVMGSVYYMAPECFIGAQSSSSVDIYALGCILALRFHILKVR